MKAFRKRLMRVFLLGGGLYGGLMGICAALAVLYFYPSSRIEQIPLAFFTGIAVLLGGGIFYGLIMTLVIGAIQVTAVSRLGHRVTDETLAVHQRRRLTIELPFAETFTLCTSAIRYLGNAEIQEETDYATGVIIAIKCWSWRSHGESLRMELSALESSTRVVVESRPRMKTTVFDAGASLRNMDALIGFLLAHGANLDEGLPPAGPDPRIRNQRPTTSPSIQDVRSPQPTDHQQG